MPLRSLLLAVLLTPLAACGGEPEPAAPAAAPAAGPSDEELAVRRLEAEARLAEARLMAGDDPEPAAEPTSVPSSPETAPPRTPRPAPAAESAPAARSAPSPSAPARPGLTGLPPEPNAPDLIDGTQPFTFCETYRRSAIARYEGMELCYVGTLRQAGDRLVGSGEKDTENGRALRGAARTPLRIEGRIYNDYAVRFNFTDRGARRVSRGSADFPESGMLSGCEGHAWQTGTFQTDAANSSGSATLFVRQRCDV